MLTKMIDASAVAAILFNEPEAALVAKKVGSSSLVAPILLWFEVTNVCLTKLTIHAPQRESILHAYALLNQLEIEPTEVDYQAVLLLAEQTRLSVYDASYLWLAQTLGTELITLDQKLLKAATSLTTSV